MGPVIQAYSKGIPERIAKKKGTKRIAEFLAVLTNPVKKLYLIVVIILKPSL